MTNFICTNCSQRWHDIRSEKIEPLREFICIECRQKAQAEDMRRLGMKLMLFTVCFFLLSFVGILVLGL